MSVVVREYDITRLVRLSHVDDAMSRGIVIARAVRYAMTVAVARIRTPFFETINVTTMQIKPASRKLRVGWHVTEDDAAATLNAVSPREMTAC